MNKFFQKFKTSFSLYNVLLGFIFVLAIFLRAKVYFANPSMWHDECALAWNVLHKNYSELFGILGYSQVAPPFFMVLSKIMVKLFGASDIVIRMVPFVAGILSLPLFYLVLKDGFKRNFTIVLALFLFAVNQQLINYSFEFKQYGVDVLCVLLCLYFFQKLNLKKISIKKLIASSVGLSLIIWFSFVSIFVIAGGMLITLLKKIKSNIKQKIILSLPLIISALFYLVIYIFHTHSGPVMLSYWSDKFIKPDLSNFLSLLVENIKYFFFPIKMVLFAFVLLIWGTVSGIKEKNRLALIILATFLVFILASVMKLYPFSDRLILFMLPLFLIIALIPFDGISISKKGKSALIIFLTVLTFYVQVPAVIEFVKIPNFSRGEIPREMMDYMIINIKPNDIIFVNSTSVIEFDYYSTFHSIENKIIQENVTNESSQEYVTFLNSLSKGYYWFYLPYDSSKKPVFPYLLPWIGSKKIIYTYTNGKSFLFYVHID